MVIINNNEKISGRFFDSASHKIDYIVYSFRKDNPPALKLTNTGEDSKLVHRRIWPKVDALFSSFFATRPSDEYDSAPSREYSRPLLNVFACIG